MLLNDVVTDMRGCSPNEPRPFAAQVVKKMADFREEQSHDLNDPPPAYGLYMESSRPPPYNPNLREGQGGERSGGTLRNTCNNDKIVCDKLLFF